MKDFIQLYLTKNYIVINNDVFYFSNLRDGAYEHAMMDELVVIFDITHAEAKLHIRDWLILNKFPNNKWFYL